jgi:hypothetical protein
LFNLPKTDAIAKADPIASPSGSICGVIRKDSELRMRSAIALRVFSIFAFLEVFEYQLDSSPLDTRVVITEGQLGDVFDSQSSSELGPDETRGTA